jgi:hypothetical protein
VKICPTSSVSKSLACQFIGSKFIEKKKNDWKPSPAPRSRRSGALAVLCRLLQFACLENLVMALAVIPEIHPRGRLGCGDLSPPTIILYQFTLFSPSRAHDDAAAPAPWTDRCSTLPANDIRCWQEAVACTIGGGRTNMRRRQCRRRSLCNLRQNDDPVAASGCGIPDAQAPGSVRPAARASDRHA